MKKAIIYTRVSTEEQSEEGASIETQIALCRKWAKDNEYVIADKGIYEDRGKSATTMNRPALQELLIRCQDDKEIVAVLVQDTDRLARNTLDHLSIKSILKKKSIVVISVSQPMLDDSPEGEVLDTVIAAVNSWQSRVTGRKVSKNLDEKAKAGYWPRPAPLGYINVENPKPTGAYDRRIIIPDPIKAPYMKQAFTLYATGNYNGQALADHLYNQGLRSKTGGILHDSMLFTYLKNPIYFGKIPHKGKNYPGHHEPLTDEETFNKVQDVLAAHNQNASRRRVHNYLLRGYVFCYLCGRRLWAEKHTKDNGLVFDMYYCKTHRKGGYVDAEHIEKQVEWGFANKIEVTPEYSAKIIEVAKTILAEFRNNTDADTKILLNRKSGINAGIREAEDNWLIFKKISADQYNSIYQRFNKELEGIDEQLNGLTKDYNNALKTINALMGMAENIGDTYKAADYELKRYYLGLFFGGGGLDIKPGRNIKKGKIAKIRLSPDIKPLITEGSVRVRMDWLRD